MLIKYSLYFVLLFSFNAFYGMEKESANLQKLEEYKSLLKTLNDPKYCRTTSITDYSKYGYHGTMVPIAKDHSFISSALAQVGYIIRKAQPSTWGGYFYMTSSSVGKNCIFIEDNNLKYTAEIKNMKNIQHKILASCVINNGSKNIMEHSIAILWKVAYQLQESSTEGKFWKKPSEKKLYITQARLSQIQEQKNELNLEENKIEVE
jgi:hypothetical protein